MHAQSPQQAGRAKATLLFAAAGIHNAAVLPAGAGAGQVSLGLSRKIQERTQRLTLREPKARLFVPNPVIQHRLDEPLHFPEKRRMVTVVGVNVVQGEQHRAKCALATLRHDDPRQIREMRRNRGHRRKLEPARAEAAFVATIPFHLEGYLREVAVAVLTAMAEVGDTNAERLVLRAAQGRDGAGVQTIAIRDGKRLGRREIQHPLPLTDRRPVRGLNKREAPIITGQMAQNAPQVCLNDGLLPRREINHWHRHMKVSAPALRAPPSAIRKFNGSAEH